MALVENAIHVSVRDNEARERLDRATLDPDTYAKQVVQGMIEHWNAFVNGEQDYFYKIFVNDDNNHTRQHRHFVRELGLESSLQNMPDDNVVLRVGNAALVQEIQYSIDDAPFGVTYTAIRD